MITAIIKNITSNDDNITVFVEFSDNTSWSANFTALATETEIKERIKEKVIEKEAKLNNVANLQTLINQEISGS